MKLERWTTIVRRKSKYYFCITEIFLLLFALTWNDHDSVLATQECGSVVNNNLTSPGYPNNYPSSMHCVYKVPVPDGMALKITFQDFHLEMEDSGLCLYDYLTVTDENNEEVGKYCGELSGKEVFVGGDHAVITFHSDYSTQERGFLLFFSAAQPTLPRITLPVPGTVVRAIAGREMLSCSASGTLPIYIAVIRNSTVLTNSTSTAVEIPLYKEGNYSCVATSKYGTDTRVISVIIIGCGSVVNITLTSPGYPSDYPNDMHCVYKVPIPPGRALKIDFQQFHLQDAEGGKCWYDYLRISIIDGNMKMTVGEYCGELTGKEVLVGGDHAVITFHSDFLSQQRGFMLSFTAAQPSSPTIDLPDPATEVRAVAGHTLLRCSAINGTPPIYIALIKNSTVLANSTNTASVTLFKEGKYSCVATSKYGTDTRVIPVIIIGCGSVENDTLKSPEYPYSYPNNMHCVYKVSIPDGMALKITFHDFYLADNWFSCPSDYLKIADENNTSLGKYCGDLTGRFTLVYGDYAEITFHSNSKGQERGFLFIFTAVQLICRPQCSLSWSVSRLKNALVCKNVSSLKRIIECAPTIIKRMDLSSNAINFLPDGSFANLTDLVHLNLSSNAIKHLPGGLFANLKNLRILDLSSNSITFLPNGLFGNLSDLIWLYLSSNSITTLHEGVFANQKKLKRLYLSSNAITLLPGEVFANQTTLLILDLSFNVITRLPESVFGNLRRLYELHLSSNAITLLPERVFANLTVLRRLFLSSNAITLLPEKVFSKLTSLGYLDLSSNAIKVLPEGVFDNVKYRIDFLDLSSNAITVVREEVFSDMSNLMELDLSSNAITVLPDGVFNHAVYLNVLNLQNNKISKITNETFAKNTQIKFLFLSSNSLEKIPCRAFFNMDFMWHEITIMLSDNPITTIEPEAFKKSSPRLIIYLLRTKLKRLSPESFINYSGLKYSKLLIENRTLRTLKYSFKYIDQYECVIYLNPHESRSEAIIVDKFETKLISAIMASGFIQTHENDKEYFFQPCPVGTFSNSTSQGAEGCTSCSPGGFYSDDAGYVSTSCKTCPNGSFVAFDKAPGTQAQDCKTCPLGTESDFFAGYRACMCMEGHYRTHMFKRCHRCQEGLECQNDYASLTSGYWWSWRNKTHKNCYRVFKANLLASLPALGEDDVQYPHPLPTPYKCPEETSCEGGIDSTCKDGYKGPLCSVCKTGYYKNFHRCKECPSKMLMTGQFLMIAAIFFIITAVCVRTSKRKNKKDEGERSLVDSFLSKIKIAIGFYQVTYGLLEAFSFIKWPDCLQIIGKYSKVLQLNILEMAPVQCLFRELHVDAFGNLFAIMAINLAVIGFAGIAYGVRKIIISRNENLGVEEKSLAVSQTKELVYRNLFFFLYVTYLSTCSKTATVLPLACRDLCRDEKEKLCLEYLKADYSIRCHGPWYNKLIIVGYISTAYILALPTATFIVLWRQRRVMRAAAGAEKSKDSVSSTELINGLHFLYENYKAHSWYWELVEMSRKVIVTSGLILVGQESRSYIGLAWVIAGMYGILFAWHRPIQDVFENTLMTMSIAVTVFNLGVGAISKIPAENIASSTDKHLHTAIFNILVLGANTTVIGLLAFQYAMHIYQYLKEWRKSPQWSFSCCLALILPLASLPGEISGLVEKNIINNQLKPGNFEMSTIVVTLQDSGAIDVTIEGDQGGDNQTEAQIDNRDDARPRNGEMEMPTFKQDNKASFKQATDHTQKDMIYQLGHPFNYRDAEHSMRTNKVPQGTQTKLSTILPVTGLVAHEPMKTTHF